jgi:FkbM family methyltransferase
MDFKTALRGMLGPIVLDGNSFVRRLVKRALGNLLADQYGYAVVRVIWGPAGGARLYLNLQSEAQYALGIYDHPEIKLISQWLDPGMTTYDCGAFIGYYTAILASLVGTTGRVITLEPDPVNHARVQKQINLNNWHQVSLLNLALGPGHSIVKFAANTGATSHIMGTYRGYDGRVIVEDDQNIESSTIEISCVNLDELVFEMGYPKPDFVKIDVEGAEHYVLSSSHRTGMEIRPIILLELHNPEGEKAAERWLATYEYIAIDVHSGNRVSTAEEFHKAGNYEQCTLFMLPREKLTNSHNERRQGL